MEFSYTDTRTPTGWQDWELVNAEVKERGVILATEISPDTVIEDVDAIDIDVDDCRDLYVLESAGHVHRYVENTDALERLPCVGYDHGFEDPRALCVTGDSIYVVDGVDGHVRAFSKHLLQLRWVSDTSFQNPVGIVHDGRYAYVLAKGTGPGDGVLARLGDEGAVRSVVSGLTSPEDVTMDAAGNRYVLDVERPDGDGEPATVVRTFTGDATDPDRAESTPTTFSRVGELPPGASSIEAVNVREVIVAVDSDTGKGMILYRYPFDGESSERVGSFEKGCSRLVARSGSANGGIEGLYAIDDVAHEVYFFEEGGRTKRNGRTSRFDAQVIKRLDSGDRGTQWHRVKLDSELGGRDTQVRLSYSATEDEEQMADSRDFRRIDGVTGEYADRLHDADVMRISDLASLDPDDLAERIDVSPAKTEPWIEHARELLVDWKMLGEPNPSDALLESAEGRYLWIKLELIGSEHSSPRVGSFRVYFPRTSYLRYLPAIYRRDEASAEFLERFLSIFESVFVDVEEEIDSVTRYLDPEAIPAGDLPWLGSWMALETDEGWPEPARRELVSRAPELFKKRGTRGGLLEILRIYLRHVQPRTAWRKAIEIDEAAVIDLVNERSISENEAKRKLGEHELLRTVSGDRGLCQMVAAWSSVLERRREILDEMVTAGFLTEDDAAEERGGYEETIQESDQASLPYLVEYARELEAVAGTVTHDRSPKSNVNAVREKYEALIRESAEHDVPYLIEASDLDCIESEDVRESYAELVGHERAFLVLVRPPVDDDDMRVIRRVVESEQPAHAAGKAVELRPWIRLGGPSYLGMNSVLSQRELVLERSSLGDDSVLDEREAYAQLGVKSRLDGDTFIS